MIWVSLYLIVGLLNAVCLIGADRIEVDFYEIISCTILWPLDLAEWVESKLR